MLKILMKGFTWKEKTIVSGPFSIRDWKLHYTYRVATNRLKPKHEQRALFEPNISTGKTAQQRQCNEIQFLFFAQRNNFQWLSCSFHNKFQLCSSIHNSFQSDTPPSVRLTFATVCVPQQCGKVWIMQPSKNVHRAHTCNLSGPSTCGS